VPAEPSIEVRALAIRLDEHAGALDRVTQILSRLELKDAAMDEEVGQLESSRGVFLEANRREKPGDPTVEQQLVEAVDKLTFDERFWPIAVDKVVRWIQMVDSEEDLPTDWPMYLLGESLYDTSRAHQILSAFGPMAPSLVDSGGAEFDIPRGLTAEDPASVEDPDTHRLRLPAIFVTGKKLHVAVNDCVNMLKKRRIRQNITERAAGYRTIKFTGEGRTKIWEALRNLPFTVQAAGKRRREDEEDREEGPSRKKGKAKEVEVEEFDMSAFL